MPVSPQMHLTSLQGIREKQEKTGAQKDSHLVIEKGRLDPSSSLADITCSTSWWVRKGRQSTQDSFKF